MRVIVMKVMAVIMTYGYESTIRRTREKRIECGITMLLLMLMRFYVWTE